MTEHFGTLRSVLHGRPTINQWYALCRHLDGLRGNTLDEALVYTEEALRRWPDALRVPPTRWLDDPDNPRRRLVRSLDLWASITQSARPYAQLAPALQGMHITHLRLSHRQRREEDMLGLLWQTTALHHLEHLDLNGTRLRLNHMDLRTLDSLPCLRTLRVLDLGGNAATLDAAALDALLATIPTPALTTLRLPHTPALREVIPTLRSWRHRRPALQTLCAVGCDLEDEEITDLADAAQCVVQTSWPTPPHLAGLERLLGMYARVSIQERFDEAPDDPALAPWLYVLTAPTVERAYHELPDEELVDIAAIYHDTHGVPVLERWFEEDAPRARVWRYELARVLEIRRNTALISWVRRAQGASGRDAPELPDLLQRDEEVGCSHHLRHHTLDLFEEDSSPLRHRTHDTTPLHKHPHSAESRLRALRDALDLW